MALTVHKAATLKAEANKAFSAKNYPEATKLYSAAIEVDSTNHVLYSNRSAAKAGQKDWQGALDDAEEVNPMFSTETVRTNTYSVSRCHHLFQKVSHVKVPHCTVSDVTPTQ